jgi:hypothetical protein
MAAGYGPSKPGGLVLVFDLDNTLIDTMDMETMKGDDQIIRDALNKKIINLVLNPAEIFRSEYPGSVDAILLLTNNNDSEYVSRVCKVIAEMIQYRGSNFRSIRNAENSSISNNYPLFFDYIMMRQNKHRNKPLEKNIGLVKTMLTALKINTDNLKERTFFFDDQEHPVMRSELADGHYIKIIGPVRDAGFLKDSPDLTDYEPILEVLRSITHNGHTNNSPPNGGPGAYHPGGAPYESNNEFNNNKQRIANGAAAPKTLGNNISVVGGRRRKSMTLKRKTKKRNTIRRRK